MKNRNLLSKILSYPDESCINFIDIAVCLDNGMCNGTISCPNCGKILLDNSTTKIDWPNGGGYIIALKVYHPLYNNDTKTLKCDVCKLKMRIEFGSYAG